MTKLGELLKAERENKGLSLHEIGMSLKINPKILKAIEDGNQNDLPAKTFLRGFVKSYAQYLRLDVKQALDMFQEEYGSTRPEEPQKTQPQSESAPQPIVSAPKYEKSLKRPDDAALPVSNNNRIYTILIAIFLLTLIAFVAKMMDKYQKESRLATETTAPIETTTSTTSTTLAAAVVEGEDVATPISSTTSTSIAGATTTSTIGASSAPTSTTLTTTTTLKPVPSTTTTTLKPAPSTTTTTTTMKAVTTTTLKSVTTTTLRAVVPVTTTSTTTSTTLAGATTTTLKTASTEVIVEALNKVKVRFSLNGGQRWDSIDLNPDQVHTFRSKTTVDLEISDGGAVNLIVNGRDRGVPGTIGRPIKLTYPK